jgi:hypothetical protein
MTTARFIRESPAPTTAQARGSELERTRHPFGRPWYSLKSQS